jgi:hypothetical protein
MLLNGGSLGGDDVDVAQDAKAGGQRGDPRGVDAVIVRNKNNHLGTGAGIRG